MVLGVLLFFGIAILFDYSKNRTTIDSVTNPGFEELTLEPLYYAFSNEKTFDSSLNGAVDVRTTSHWKEDVRKRWITLLIFVASALVLCLLGRLLPQSEHMQRFDSFLRPSNNIEIIQNDEVQLLQDSEP